MERILNTTIAQLALFFIVLILFWSVVVRFPWIVAVAVLVATILMMTTQWKGARR